MTTAIKKAVPQEIATVRTQAMRTALDEESAIRKMVSEYVNKHMVEGTDFGVIPGTKNPTLLKPGAQKLVSLFRCRTKFKLEEKISNFETGLFSYIFSVRLISRDTKEVLAEGYGSANSREGRYRWREGQRKCPKCAKATLFQSKRPGEGFYCWDKKGGCGAKFGQGDTAVTSQVLGKVENDDIASSANTILKMAKKRAEVDGAIALAHCADMFTQDMEDMAEPAAVVDGEVSTQKQASAREVRAAPAPQPEPAAAQAEQTAPVRSRIKKLFHELQIGRGLREDQCRIFVAPVVGQKPSNQWTETDVLELERALHLVAER